jgi:hypothetical protein
MVQTEVEEKIKTNLLYSIFLSLENYNFYKVMWKNMVDSDKPQITI